MKLISIHARDFCLFEDIELVLNEQGLVWIGGVNEDSDSANSNGSGKSTVLKAIAWGLYGESIDGKSSDEVIREGTKAAVVQIMFEHDGDMWTVTRTRRKGQPRVELKRAADPDKWPGSRLEIQSKLDNMMGLDWLAFKSTVLYGQGDRKRFTDPTTSDSDRKALFASILRTDILAICYEWVKGEALKLKREADVVDGEITKLQGKIGEYDIPSLQEEHDGWDEEQRERVEDIAARARAALEKAKAANAKRTEATELQARIAAKTAPDPKAAAEARSVAQGAVTAANEERATARSDRTRLKAKIEAIDEQLGLVEGEDSCPVCSSPLGKGHAKKHLDQLRADREMLKEQAEAVRVIIAAADLKVEAAERDLEAAEKHERETLDAMDGWNEDLAAVARLLSEAGRAEEYAQEARDRTAEARAAKEATNPHAKALEDAKAKVKGYRLDIKARRARLDELNIERAHYLFWVKGFSGQGLPSFILDSVMPYITERANHYLDILADGDITMNFATQRELKSARGEMRDEISIEWEIEGVSEYAPSGGQLKKMEIATDLALMDLVATREGAHPDILMLDEILDGLDAEGRNRVTQLLHELRKVRETILVISHDESIAEVFERSVLVVKKGGVSRIEARAAA